MPYRKYVIIYSINNKLGLIEKSRIMTNMTIRSDLHVMCVNYQLTNLDKPTFFRM